MCRTGNPSLRHGLSSPEVLRSPAGYVVPPGHRLLLPHPKFSPPAAGLFLVRRNLALRSVGAGPERVPNLSCSSFLIVPSSVPRRLGDFSRLLLHRLLWPSPPSHRIGIRFCTLAGSSLRGSCYEAAKFASCYGPMRWLALLRLGRLLSSFHLLGHPSGMSNITTRVNNQFPWPDLHRLDKQPYRLRTKITKVTKTG